MQGPAGSFPPCSRLMIDVISKDHFNMVMKFKDILATYREAEDLVNIGAYARGSNPKIDLAIKKIDAFTQYLRQGITEDVDMGQSIDQLNKILEG